MRSLLLPTLRVGIARAVAIAVITSLAGSALADKKGGGPVTNGAECYNEVTESCNKANPGKDMGDAQYAGCINHGLDVCDAAFPNIINKPPGRTTPPGSTILRQLLQGTTTTQRKLL